MRKSRAFTLVELLVVVAIIALLIGISVPLLGHAKESAKTAKCQSNLHQVAVGLTAYGSAFGQIPNSYYRSPTGSQYIGNLYWPEALVAGGFVQTIASRGEESGFAVGIFICPSHDLQFQGPPGVPRGTAAGVDVNHDLVHYEESSVDGYGLNPLMVGDKLSNVNPCHILAADATGVISGVGGVGYPTVRGTTPGDSTETGMADCVHITNHSWYGVYSRHPGGPVYAYPTYVYSGTTYTRIPNGSNFLFADGHVEFSTLYGHISPASTGSPGQFAQTSPYYADRPPPWNYWLNP